LTEPTIAAGYVRGLFAYACARGADPAGLLAGAGLTRQDLEDQDARLPALRYALLMKTAKALTGDAALALHFGETVNLAEVSIVGLLGNASETIMDAFVQLNRYARLVADVATPGDRYVLDRSGGQLWMIDTRPNPNAFIEQTETTFASMVHGLADFGAVGFVMAVEVTHADPGYAAEYERVLRAPVTFGAARNAMRLDPAWTNHRVAQLPRYVFGVLTERAEALLQQLNSTRTMQGRVEATLLPVLHRGAAGMDYVAGQLSLSRQTLHRKLKAEGVTFEKVLDGLRHRMALDYLSGRKVSVNETAYLVGFSDPAAFSRAFKRWTGKSPSAVRG
jgi:AraC-like DNA-binding protein